MPRTASIDVAENETFGVAPSKVSSWITSAVWRWPVGLKERMAPLRSGWCEPSPGAPPEPDDPVLHSITVGTLVSTTPALNSGYSPRMLVVAMHPALLIRSL